MHIGLIGGIGPAATDVYYRALIAKAAAKKRDLDLTIVHADATTLLANLEVDDQAAQCIIYDRLTQRLVRAGADFVVVTSIAGHFCIDRFAATSPLPVVDLTASVRNGLDAKGLGRVGILGTATVMSTGVYGKLNPVTVLAPEGDALRNVHEAYVTLARSGLATPALEAVFVDEAQNLVARGAEAILLGGTDLNAIFSAEETRFPVVDCAALHIEDIAKAI